MLLGCWTVAILIAPLFAGVFIILTTCTCLLSLFPPLPIVFVIWFKLELLITIFFVFEFNGLRGEFIVDVAALLITLIGVVAVDTVFVVFKFKFIGITVILLFLEFGEIWICCWFGFWIVIIWLDVFVGDITCDCCCCCCCCAEARRVREAKIKDYF